MRTAATDPNATRHRLLEGILLRLAQSPDPGEFVLRGGVLLRHWVRPIPRPADDLDLVATFPFSVAEAARRFLPVLADTTVADGVTFDPEATRVDGIFLDTGQPGVRIFTCGTFDGREDDLHIDITSGPFPRPDPVFSAIRTASGTDARVWVCRPEAIVGQKVQALRHLGMLGWRQKDLNDLHLLLTRVPIESADLRTAIAAYLVDLGGTLDDARALFGPDSWWTMKLSAARWRDFATAARDQDVPTDLRCVVADIAGRLAPVLVPEGAT
jgi:hypothetical protein